VKVLFTRPVKLGYRKANFSSVNSGFHEVVNLTFYIFISKYYSALGNMYTTLELLCFPPLNYEPGQTERLREVSFVSLNRPNVTIVNYRSRNYYGDSTKNRIPYTRHKINREKSVFKNCKTN